MPKGEQPIVEVTSEPLVIYQLKITLRDSKPPIWRRVQVPADIQLQVLHHVVQFSFGWADAHLHQFSVDQTFYAMPEIELEWAQDEREFTLQQLAPEVGSKLTYEYDFGDGWEHQIVVEKILPPTAGAVYPRCLKGVRAGPLEDSGGIYGYMDLILAYADPTHPNHKEIRRWVGKKFDPTAFDLERVNKLLHHLAPISRPRRIL